MPKTEYDGVPIDPIPIDQDGTVYMPRFRHLCTEVVPAEFDVGETVFVQGTHIPATITERIFFDGKFSHYKVKDLQTSQVYDVDLDELRPCTRDEWDGRILEMTGTRDNKRKINQK